MKKNFFGAVSALLGLILILAPKYITPVCGPMANGKFMKCHWMGNITIGIGAILIVLAIIFTLSKDINFKRGLAVSNMAFGVLEILNAHVLIGGCMKADMSCNAKTIPFVTIISVILILENFYYFIKGKNN